MNTRPKAINFSWLGPEFSSVAWSTGAQLIFFITDRSKASIRLGKHRIVLISLRTVILVSIDSISHNASMSLIQYLVVSLQFGSTVTN